MSRLDRNQRALLEIEIVTKSKYPWTKEELVNEINQIIDKTYE